jgi:hypothetical protein
MAFKNILLLSNENLILILYTGNSSKNKIYFMTFVKVEVKFQIRNKA